MGFKKGVEWGKGEIAGRVGAELKCLLDFVLLTSRSCSNKMDRHLLKDRNTQFTVNNLPSSKLMLHWLVLEAAHKERGRVFEFWGVRTRRP